MDKTLERYVPKGTQEETDYRAFMAFLKQNDDAYLRSNLVAHVTASAFVVNETLDKVLFVHHDLYGSWGWVGGHADGDKDLLRVALKEAKEETGLKKLRPFTEEILTLDILYVRRHEKNGAFVGDHLHLNVAYLLVASEEDAVRPCKGENSAVAWFTFSEALRVMREEKMREVYEKAFARIEGLRNQD